MAVRDDPLLDAAFIETVNGELKSLGLPAAARGALAAAFGIPDDVVDRWFMPGTAAATERIARDPFLDEPLVAELNETLRRLLPPLPAGSTREARRIRAANVTAIAAELGVTERTVERWAKPVPVDPETGEVIGKAQVRGVLPTRRGAGPSGEVDPATGKQVYEKWESVVGKQLSQLPARERRRAEVMLRYMLEAGEVRGGFIEPDLAGLRLSEVTDPFLWARVLIAIALTGRIVQTPTYSTGDEVAVKGKENTADVSDLAKMLLRICAYRNWNEGVDIWLRNFWTRIALWYEAEERRWGLTIFYRSGVVSPTVLYKNKDEDPRDFPKIWNVTWKDNAPPDACEENLRDLGLIGQTSLDEEIEGEPF